MKFSIGRWTFCCPLLLIAAYALLLVLLLNLGFWQLKRVDEKQKMLDKQVQAQNAAPMKINRLMHEESEDLRYQKAVVRGHYQPERQFLLDNQILNGKVGYFVLTPFVIEDWAKTAILVNRGWIAANPNRHILPDVSIKTAQPVIHGRINYFPSVGIKLEGAGIPTQTSPALIQIVETAILEKKLGYALLPFQLELDETMPEGYTRQWLTTTLMPPERHFGYALQWFGLAFALTFLFFWYSSKKTHDE